MSPRALIHVLMHGLAVFGLLASAWAAPGGESSGRAARRWLSDLVTRIDAADQAAHKPGTGRRAGTVVIRAEITADGSVQRVEVERSSGSPELDQRALRAVRAVGPLPAPPAPLLKGFGVADLSIPVALDR